MGLLSWLKSKTKRERKPRKPPEVPTEAQQEGGPSRSKSGEDEAAENVVFYPLFDPRHVTPRGSLVPLLEQREPLLKQLTSIPAEMKSGELITLPRSKSSSEASEPSAQVPELVEEEEEMPLAPLKGDQSPLSGVSMEAALAMLTRKPSRAPSLLQQEQQQEPPVQQQQQEEPPVQQQQQEEPPVQQQQPVVAPRPASPQRPVPPPKKTEPELVPPPKPQEKKQPPPEPQRVRTPPPRSPPKAAPKHPPAPAPAEILTPLPLPPKMKTPSSSSRSSSSRSSSSRSSSRRSSKTSSVEAVSSRSSLPSVNESSKSEASLDIEDMPTAPTTPRMPSRVLQHSKQPRLLLLQPYTKPHPATTRMQRQGRRCLLRCAQLQAAIDFYAATGGLKAFRVQPHDTEQCQTCNYADFTDAPLLW
ncbi:hypothetical protein Emag_004406 [Eimeria magna]